MLQKLKRRRPSPAMVVALVALVAALGGTAYAAGRINGNSIVNQSIGGGKLKKKTLTGSQVNVNKLGEVPLAKRTPHTFWAVVHNPAGQGNATLTRASDAGVMHLAARRGLRPDQHLARRPERDRSPHQGQNRRQPGQRLQPDRRLPIGISATGRRGSGPSRRDQPPWTANLIFLLPFLAPCGTRPSGASNCAA